MGPLAEAGFEPSDLLGMSQAGTAAPPLRSISAAQDLVGLSGTVQRFDAVAPQLRLGFVQ